MGYCLITGGGADGRYDIELDFGKAQKDAILAALATAINKNELDIVQTEQGVAQAQAQEQALGLVLLQLQDAIATGNAQQKAEATIEYPKRAAELAKLKVQNEPLRGKLRQLKFVRASLRKQAQQFNMFQPIQRRQAWCADLTEDRAAGSYVGTIEVKGEPDLVLIQPGARGWIPTDGRVAGREIMSPWQAYWNAAVLPGWQKWKPTYRWGTLTAIDHDSDTCELDLAPAKSSARRLDINARQSLVGVPIVYMECNSAAFKVGDRVIVSFQNQSNDLPRVIGFLDNPKTCLFTCMGTEAIGTGMFYACRDPAVVALLDSTTLDVKVRLDMRPWEDAYFVSTTVAPGLNVHTYSADFPPEAYYTPDALHGQEAMQLAISTLPGIGVFAGAPPLVQIKLKPPIAQLGTPSVRAICEFAIYIGGDLIFNAAINDDGISGYPARLDRRSIGRSGIRLEAPFYGPVTDLNYVLTA